MKDILHIIYREYQGNGKWKEVATELPQKDGRIWLVDLVSDDAHRKELPGSGELVWPRPCRRPYSSKGILVKDLCLPGILHVCTSYQGTQIAAASHSRIAACVGVATKSCSIATSPRGILFKMFENIAPKPRDSPV